MLEVCIKCLLRVLQVLCDMLFERTCHTCNGGHAAQLEWLGGILATVQVVGEVGQNAALVCMVCYMS